MKENKSLMWVPQEFRRLVYRKKAENPDKSLIQILKEMASDDDIIPKRRTIFGKI